MKRSFYYVLFVFLLHISQLHAQVNSTLKVVGNELRKVNGERLVLKGVNYNLLDDGNIYLSQNSQTYYSYIDQVALTGANSIRIPWFTDSFQHWRKDYPNTGTPQSALDQGYLSNLIGYCHQKGLVPILEIHDYTCGNNWSSFTTAIQNWWLQPNVLSLIETHKAYLIINIANEFGKVRWTDNQSQSLITFRNNYQTIIGNLRNAGINVPIMIDAPDCGQSSTELLSIAPNLLNADPQRNIIFSAHTYWYGYAPNVAAVNTKITEIVNSGVCFVFGEVSNRQDVTSAQADGVYNLDVIYKEVLTKSCQNNIGWLVWAFNHDWHPDRKMSPTSRFNNLTQFGNDIVYNTTYGFISGSCQSVLDNDKFIKNKILFYPNPASDKIIFENSEAITNISIYSTSGQLVAFSDREFEMMNIEKLSSGVYYILIKTNDGVQREKLVVSK